MLSILLSVIFGLAIGYFATQNTAPVNIQFGDFVFQNVPLYLVTVGSLIVGLLIVWIFYIARTVSTTLTIAGKDREVKRSNRTVAELEQKIRDLEAENMRLRTAGATNYSIPADVPNESLRLEEQRRREQWHKDPL